MEQTNLKQPKTLVMANQKGGVGKTVTSMGLAQLLAARGFKVLAIDLDPQGNLTKALGGDKDAPATIFEVLVKKIHPIEALQVINDNLHILPSAQRLSNFEREAIDGGINHRLLKYAIEPLAVNEYDYIIIDTPPALGLLSTIALTACKNGGIIIPAFPDAFSEDGIKEFWITVLAAKEFTNPDVKVLGILLTNHNPKTIIGQVYKDNYDEIAQLMGARTFKTFIRRNIKLAEASSTAQSLKLYEKSAPNLIDDYNNLIDEINLILSEGEKDNE